MRAVNQIISYDLPFIFAALVPMLAGSLKRPTSPPREYGGAWFIFYPVIGQLAFIAFVVASSRPRTVCPSTSSKPSQGRRLPRVSRA
jgi:NADH:ubiquinone oxidoreductase subunit H